MPDLQKLLDTGADLITAKTMKTKAEATNIKVDIITTITVLVLAILGIAVVVAQIEKTFF